MTPISATRPGIAGSTVLTVTVPTPATAFIAAGKATVNLQSAGPDPGEAKVIL
jgi:hypothetical protein